jgi:WD40 repeat protein
MAQIFISHSSRDTEQAAALLACLHAHGFAETFLDFDKHAGLAPGSDWERTLYREIAGADAVILILTRNWFDSKWCFAEFTQARALGKAIFPLLDAPAGEAFVSLDIQHLDLNKDREGGLARLTAELTEILVNARGGFAWDHTRPPYPGLLAFNEADAAIYFGRDDDIRRLIERLNARRAQGGAKMIAVLGASGSGKSSLLRAGVLPRLKRDQRNWIVLPPFRPQLHPIEELAQVVSDALGKSADWRLWRDAFAAEDVAHALSDLARDLRAAHGSNEAQILITVDQAEELFGAAERAESEQFLRVLNALQGEHLPFIVAMTMRSDYLGELQEAPELTAPFEEFSLKPMPLARIREIIEGPARVAGMAVDEALIAAAMKDAATDDALPLLAFALRELYDRFGNKKHLTLEAYLALGDNAGQLSPLENAVRRKADEVLAAAKPAGEDLQALREAFVPAMVRVNAEGEYVRRPARFDLLPIRAIPLIERLAKARLLIIHKEQELTLVEVAHEALLRKWPLLRGWLDEAREFLIGKDQLERDLLDWERAPAEQTTEALLAGLKLTRARAWLLEYPLRLSEAERRFIQASIAHYEAEATRRERLRRRLQQASMAAAAVLAVCLAGAVWEWWVAKTHAATAESRELAAIAEQYVGSGGDLGLALQTAEQAARRAPTDQAEHALRTVLEGPLEHLVVHHGGPVYIAAFSPDGNRIVTASADHTARVWEVGSGRLLATLSGHSAPVNDAAFSPDGSRIVTASDDGTARVWNAQDGNPLATLNGTGVEVRKAAFSPDGRRIVTASADYAARIWESETGQLRATLNGHSGVVYKAAFSPDGSRIVTASDDGTARVWNAETGVALATLSGHSRVVYAAAFSPDGSRIVTASWDQTARVWDAETGHLLTTLSGHSGALYDAEFSPDGRHIVTASADYTALVWAADSGQQLAILRGHAAPVNSAVFSPDGRRIVTASEDGTARVWDADAGHLRATLSGGNGVVFDAAFSRDGSRIVTASNDGTARVWDAEIGHPLAVLSGNGGRLFDASFSPDGKRIMAAGEDNTARIWDAQTHELRATLAGHTLMIYVASFSPDGKRVVTASADKTARVWEADNGRLQAVLTGLTRRVNYAAFSPDGKRVVAASDDGNACVWDAESGHLQATLTGHTDMVNVAEFSPDGKRIVTAGDDSTARIWEADSGRLLAVLSHTAAVNDASFSPDGKRIVTASYDHTARLWDARSGALLHTLAGHSLWVYTAAFSPNGKRIVTASADHTARVWETSTGRLLATLSAHTARVNYAAFSPDGERIVTASQDNTARIWNTRSGLLLGTLTGHTDQIYTARFSPDGRRIVTASSDNTARIFFADLHDLLAWAKQQLPAEGNTNQLPKSKP